MKSFPVLMSLLAMEAGSSASAAGLMLDFGNPAANTAASETNATSPGPVAASPYLTLSPGHAVGAVAPDETAWNTITLSSPRADLSYADGTSATGITLTLGQEAAAGSNTIDYSSAISTLNLVGNGGGSGGRQSYLTPGSIYGDNRLSSSAVGRDGFFGGAGAAIGFRVDGLPAGDYVIYLMGRNTNSNSTAFAGMTFYAASGGASGTFANFNTAASAFQSSPTFASAGYQGQYDRFQEGENYVALQVSIAAGQSLHVAVDGSETETRGFLNMAQIVPLAELPTAFTWSKGDGDWDDVSTNWNFDTESYVEPALTDFPTLIDAIDGVNSVNLTTSFAPTTVHITNTGDWDTTAYAFTGSGGITGATGITKSGSGIARFATAGNSYSGTLAVRAGAVVKELADGSTGDVAVTSGATFALSGGVAEGGGQTLSIAGPGNPNTNYFFTGSTNQRGALQALSGDNTWAGDIVLAGTVGSGGNTRIGVQNGASLTLTGNITEWLPGMSPYFRAGDSATDEIALAGVGSWTGPTRIFSNGGVVRIAADERLPSGSSLIVGSSAGQSGPPTFDLGGFDQTVAGLGGTGGDFPPLVRNSGATRSILTVNPAAEISFPGSIEGDIQLVVGGTSPQLLTGDNRHHGGTVIQSGAKLVVSDTGELWFQPGANGITNSIGGNGALQFDGTLRIDLAAADPTSGNEWPLVDTSGLAEVVFGSTFIVTGPTGDFTETEPGSGDWRMSDGTGTWIFLESSGVLTLTGGSADPFDAWIAGYFPGETDPEIVGKDADPDHDGHDNLTEFALNGDPGEVSDSGYLAVALEDTDADSQRELTLTLAVRKGGTSPVFAGAPLSAVSDGVRYTIEGSLDLVFPASAVSEAAPAGGPEGLPAEYEYRRFRLDASAGLPGSGFLRVKIDAAP
jgi:autotransporter-associated beta strand protein